MQKYIFDWKTWPLDIQDEFIKCLEGECEEGLFMREDEEVLIDLKNFSKKNNLNISEQILKNCLKILNQLPAGHGQYSKKAIQKLCLFWKRELEDTAIKSVGWHHSDRKYKGELLNKLPHYKEVLKNHCIPVNLKSDQNDCRIPNPTVHIAFNQLRLLVNDIIKIHGRPLQIVIETARDLPLGQKTKRELEKRQRENTERNEEAKSFINDFTETNNRSNRLRYQLWKEQNKTCIYSGKKIPKSKLFDSELEVDHILPYSKTLDNSFMNKVLVYKSSNQQKGNQTPFEAFASDKENWKSILQRVSKEKRRRFNQDAMERFEEDGDFLARQLNDTRYISKYAKEYLERICDQVWTVRGQTTALLRYLLQYEEKNREDYRNHAKDALVIGLVDRSLIQHISKIAKNIEGQNKPRLENIGKAIKQDVIPWSSFKEDSKQVIDKIVVSHRRRTKKEGQLHNETAYGTLNGNNDLSQSIEVIHYVDILALDGMDRKKIDSKLISKRIKKDFLKELENSNKLSKEFLINYHKTTGVRRVRLKEKQKVIPIKNRSEKIYKYFNGAGNYAMEFIEHSNGKWDARVVDTFSANQKCFTPIPDKFKLMKGDMLFFNNKFWKLVKFDQNRTMIFLEHHISGNPDILRRNEHTKYHVNQKSPSSLQESNPKRVDISPCGVVKLSNFFLIKIDSKKSDKSA